MSNVLSVLPSVFELGITIVNDVKAARRRDSDGGRKITRQEWTRIVSKATAELAIGLTQAFAADLDDDAQDMFSDARPSLAA